ncbi:SCO family protein [Massilia sp. LXY-6]|uniref:SCO family protein n=1 Tax=Massilia sp. LXY-6 TaxID=3379823 RepID=UPI003EDEA0C8
MSRALPIRASLILFLALGWGWSPAGAQALRLPPQPVASFAPSVGARLPLDAVLRDEAGAALPLGALFGGAPVVLVPGYYSCPNLCSTLFEGVLQALALSGMAPGSYRLVGFSIDPRDGAAAATGKRRAYAALLPGGVADLRMLTGDATALVRIEAALGYRAPRDPASGEFAHAAGFVVADAAGRIVQYFPGVRFEPAALRTALAAAREGSSSNSSGGEQKSLGERLLLLCTHYDPAVGQYSGAAMASVRAGVLLAVLGMGGAAWRFARRRRPSRAVKGGRP